MTNEIFTSAAQIREHFATCGEPVGPLSCSTNRDGGHSAYFSIGGGFRIRVSDHSCNTDFRVSEGNVAPGSDLAEVRAYLNRLNANTAAETARRAEMNRQVAAAEAAAKAKRQAENRDAERKAQDMKARRIAFFAAAGIDFDACRGDERQAARDAFAAALARGEA